MEQFLKRHLPFWASLTEKDQRRLLENSRISMLYPDRVLQPFGEKCNGVKLIKSGQVRVFVTSPEGEEINLYRMLPGDVCVLSILCMNEDLKVNLSIQAEKEAEVCIIPADLYRELSETTPAVREFNRHMVSLRLGHVMTIIEHMTFSSVRKRLAGTLVYHSCLNHSEVIPVTHEMLAKDIGTAREVVTRTLQEFQKEGLVSLHRGKIILLNKSRLKAL